MSTCLQRCQASPRAKYIGTRTARALQPAARSQPSARPGRRARLKAALGASRGGFSLSGQPTMNPQPALTGKGLCSPSNVLVHVHGWDCRRRPSCDPPAIRAPTAWVFINPGTSALFPLFSLFSPFCFLLFSPSFFPPESNTLYPDALRFLLAPSCGCFTCHPH